MKHALKKRTLRLEQLENRELLSATTWDNAAQADAAVAAEMAEVLDETTAETIELASLIVNTVDDVVDNTDNKISLREALAHMADGVGNTVTFDASLDGATIKLTQGELVFTNNTEYRGLKIDASSLENGITVDAQGQSRVFNVVKASSNFAPTFNNLTIANGYVDGNGAGIYSGLSSAYGVKLVNCVVDGNVATGSGAGVYSAGATVSGTTFSNNEAGVDGGGLYFAGSNMSITSSTFENNVADGNGGGLYVGGANNTFDALVFTGNEASNGGGLYATSNPKVATNLTFDGNKATVDGGGVYFTGSKNVTFENLTVTNNEAGRDGGGIFAGTGRNTAMGGSVSGGIALLNSTITDNIAGREGGGVVTGSSGIAATSALIADNVAGTNGGGIRLYGSGSKLYNVTIAGNKAADGAGVYSQSYNAYYDSIILANLDTTGAPNDIEHHSSRSTGYNVLSEYADWDADPIISGWGPSEAIPYVAADGVTDYSDVFEDAANGDYTLSQNSQALVGGVALGAFEYGYDIPSTVVTTATDVVDATDGKISLREALAHMADGVGNTVTFDASLDGATIKLTQGELVFTNNTEYRGLKIDASSLENGITIDAQGQSRVFNIVKASSNFAPTFNNLTIANGYVDGDGAGIYSGLSSAYGVKLINCVVDGNVATGSGAGVYSLGATVSGTTFSNNEAGGNGGGLYFTGSNMSITASTFENNVATGSGGGLYVGGANNTFDELTFAGNEAGANGGGVAFVAGSSKQTKTTNLTVTGNKAGVDGGGIYFTGSNTTFENLTVTGNEAVRDGGGMFAGSGRNTAMGGSVSGSAILLNATITDNIAGREGGGIVAGSATITSTLIADNTAGTLGGGIRLYGSASKLTSVTIAGNTAEDGAGVYAQAHNAFYDSIILANLDTTGAANDIAHYGSYRSVGYNVLSEHADWDDDPILSSWTPSENAIIYEATDGVTDYSDVFANADAGDYSLAEGSQALGQGADGSDLGAFDSPYLAAPTLSVEATGASTVAITLGEIADAAGYVVEYSTSADFADAITVDGLEVSGLSSMTTYYFRAKAVGDGETSFDSFYVEASALTRPQTPGAITFLQQQGNLAQFAPGAEFKDEYLDDAWLSVSWEYCENKPVYELQYRVAGENGDWITVECEAEPKKLSDGSVRPKAGVYLDELTPGETYEFQVRSVDPNNAANVSEYTEISTFAMTAAPSIAFDEATNVASWTGSDAAAKYRLEVSTVPFASTNVAGGANVRVYVLDGETTSQALNTLQAGQTYYFRVRAHRADGAGISAWSYATWTASELAAPSDVSFVQNGDVARVNWTDVALETGYRVEYRAVGEDAWTVGAARKADFEYAFLKGLQAETTYEYRVVAVSGSAEAASAVSTFTLTSTPTIAFDEATNVASWTGSDAAAKYRLEVSSGANVRVYVLDGETTSQVLDTLQAGETYSFRVRAHQADGGGVSAWSNVVEYTVPALSAPSDVSFVQNGDVARINWTDVALETGYRVEYRAVGEDAWTVGAARKADFEYAFLKGLQAETTYEYRVVAVSGSAEAASAVSTFTLTSAPTVAFDAATNVASWSGSDAAAKYRLEVSTVPFASSSVSSGANVRVYVLDGETTSQALNTLQAGQTYYFRVRAHQADGGGVSAWSDVVEYTVPTSESSEVVSDAFAELFAEEADDDFWFEFEKALGGRK